jgi:hypothetical protein
MEQYELRHKGELIFTGTENECYIALLKKQGMSIDWSMRHEGWTVTPKSQQSEISDSKI